MITNEGSMHIKRYLAGQVGTIAEAIGFGLGGAPESALSSKLQFEFEKVEIILTSYDFVEDKLVFKAILPTEFAGIVREVGLWSLFEDTDSEEFGSRMLITFDSAAEEWVNASFSAVNARVGADALVHNPAAGTTSVSSLGDIFLDLYGHSDIDSFSLAVDIADANCDAISISFLTDAANYVEYTITDPVQGYQVYDIPKGSFAVTGVPNWGDIRSIEVATTAAAGAATTVTWDGLRIEDMDALNPDYILVAREVLTVPVIKSEGQMQEIEFALGVNIT